MEQVIIKNNEEIEVMRKAGKILAMVLGELKKKVAAGVSTEELNNLAEKLIVENGAIPSFKNYKGAPNDVPFPTALCASINEEIVHTPAVPGRALKEGDIISLDLGLKYPNSEKGLFVDASFTTGVGDISEEAKKIIATTEEVFYRGLKKVKPGNFISDIGKEIQQLAEGRGYSVVRDLVGHGVGHRVHEAPKIPNFFAPSWDPVLIKEGMTICIEPMVCIGDYKIKTKDDGWTVVTADGKLSSHYEHTILVTKDGYEILTK